MSDTRKLCLNSNCFLLSFSSVLPGLNECDTDDDVAMHLLRNTEGFEKYLQYFVGQSQAEAAISEKAVHQYFKVCINPGLISHDPLHMELTCTNMFNHTMPGDF